MLCSRNKVDDVTSAAPEFALAAAIELAPHQRTLTITCSSGLANRLRALLSGRVVAQLTGRAYTMVWPRTLACAATFDELFTNTWNVRMEVDRPGPPPIRGSLLRGQAGIDWLFSSSQHLFVAHVNWLYSHIPALDQPALQARTAACLAELQPLPELQQRIDLFAQTHFRTAMIGVHLRRGDFVHRRPDFVANTTQAIAQVDRLVDEMPGAGILLCTDDGAVNPLNGAARHEGIRVRFRRRYGKRVVVTCPRSLDRRTPIAIQDALVDLWLLRRTDAVVGSTYSSFSALAVFGRDVPWVEVGGARKWYQLLAVCSRWTGLEWLLRRAPPGARFPAGTPFYSIWESYAMLLMRRWRRLR